MISINYYRKKINWSRIWTKSIAFVHLQLFLTVLSLPILIAWGLPFSALSFLGNLIFTLPLTLFLLISALIFFCELLSIPNGFFIWLLDKLTILWTWCLSPDCHSWLIGFNRPPLIILITITLLAFVIIHYRRTHPKHYATVLFCLLLFMFGIYLKIGSSYRTSLITIPRTRGALTVLHINNELIVIDPGYIGSTLSATSWVCHTLIPEIIKHTGTLTINHLIVLQLNKATIKALTALCTKMTVKKLYTPWWTGILKGKGWHHYTQLIKRLQEKGGEHTALKDIPTIIPIHAKPSLVVKPTGKQNTYNTITYPLHCVESTIDNHSFTIYAAKHTKTKRIS